MRLTACSASLPRSRAAVRELPRQDQLVQLLTASGRGDAAAFARLHKLVAPRLLRFTLRMHAPYEFAEDVVQESLIAIWRQSATYDPDLASPMTWMVAITRNKAFDAFRANRVRFNASEDVCVEQDNEDATAPSPCCGVEQRQAFDEIRRCLGKLVAEQRGVIEMAYLQELTHVEVAAECGKPLGTIKTWIRRGMDDMRRHMAHACV